MADATWQPPTAPQITFADVSDHLVSQDYSPFFTEISWLAQAGIATGETQADGSLVFRPTDVATRLDVAAMLYAFAGEPAFAADERLDLADVAELDADMQRPLAWLSDATIAEAWLAQDATEFASDGRVTRAAIASVLYWYAGSPEVAEPEQRTFIDVDPGSPFFDAVQWMWDEQIASGWTSEAGTEFRPHAELTRGGLAALLYRLDVAGVWYGSADGSAPGIRHSTLTVYGTPTVTVHSGPGDAHEAIATVERGAALEVVGPVSDDGWINVVADGVSGWVPGYHVAGTEGAAISRVSAHASNGELEASHLCALSWDRDQQLLCQAATDLERLNAAFYGEFGIAIPVSDSYRNFAGQVRAKSVFGYLAATPGTSRHGWGAAIDISGHGLPGGYTGEAYTWLVERLAGYNWVLPEWARPGGSKPEPWHFEYTG